MGKLIWIGGLFVLGCSESRVPAQNGADAAVAVGIAALSGAVQFGNTTASHRSFKKPYFTVATCNQSAIKDSCISGIKKAAYSNCSTSLGDTYSGNVTLTFSTPTCNLNTNPDSLIRTLDITRTKSQFTISATSASHTDYRGVTIGGGDKITKSGQSTYDIEILGQRKVALDSKENTIFALSVRTTTPMILTGSLDGNRTVDGGKLEVIHNAARYTAVFEPKSVVYSSATCCYPNGGEVTVNYEGTVNGTGTVTFSETCGVATLTRQGSEQSVELMGCD